MSNSDIGFVQSHFDDLVARRGKLATWRAAFRCSCWNIGSGNPLASCKACSGSGYVYQVPVTERIVLQTINTKLDFLPMGEWENGDIIASIPNQKRVLTPTGNGTIETWAPHPFWDIGMGDLVSIPDSEQRFSEHLVRGTMMWKRAADTLSYAAIKNVLAVLVSDPVAGTVTTFTQGTETTDFTVSGGVVTWLAGSTADYTKVGNKMSFNPNGANAKNLATGGQYSVTYTHYTTYSVYQELPQARDQDGQHMPRRVVLRLKGDGKV